MFFKCKILCRPIQFCKMHKASDFFNIRQNDPLTRPRFLCAPPKTIIGREFASAEGASGKIWGFLRKITRKLLESAHQNRRLGPILLTCYTGLDLPPVLLLVTLEISPTCYTWLTLPPSIVTVTCFVRLLLHVASSCPSVINNDRCRLFQHKLRECPEIT